MKLYTNPLSYDNAINLLKTIDLIVVGNSEFASRIGYSYSLEEIEKLHQYATSLNKEVYVLINRIFHDNQIDALNAYLNELKQIGITTLIFGDLGVITLNETLGFKLIYAPETLNTNYESLSFYDAYCSGYFLAREINLDEITKIKKNSTKLIAMQIHGHQYMMESKRKLLSAYASHFNKPLQASSVNKPYIIHESNSEVSYNNIYEDDLGTHVFSNYQVCCLDIINTIKATNVDLLFIDSIFMNEKQLDTIVGLYQNALDNKDVDMNLLASIAPHSGYSYGFFFDKTVYTIEDARLRENNNEKN